jgi:hypothetical protein
MSSFPFPIPIHLPALATYLTQIGMKTNNTSDGLQHLLWVLRPIIIFFVTIKICVIIKMIIDLPESRWTSRAMDIVIPSLLSIILHR